MNLHSRLVAVVALKDLNEVCQFYLLWRLVAFQLGKIDLQTVVFSYTFHCKFMKFAHVIHIV